MKVKLTKKNKIRWAIELVILIGMIITFVVINKNIDKENEKKETEGYKYWVDILTYKEASGELYATGWIIKENVPCPEGTQRANLKMILAKDGEMNEIIEIPLESYARQDVNKNYGNGEIDYTNSGYKGTVKVGKEILQNKYRVLLQYDSNVEKYIYTTKYLDKGTLITEYSQWDY